MANYRNKIILKNHGGVEKNSLNKLTENDTGENEHEIKFSNIQIIRILLHLKTI